MSTSVSPKLGDSETRLCSQFLGPGDHFLQSYGAIFTDRAVTGSGNLVDQVSTYDRQKINAYELVARARRARARVSINFHKFSPCMAHAARARGFDSLPSLSDVGTLSFR